MTTLAAKINRTTLWLTCRFWLTFPSRPFCSWLCAADYHHRSILIRRRNGQFEWQEWTHGWVNPNNWHDPEDLALNRY